MMDEKRITSATYKVPRNLKTHPDNSALNGFFPGDRAMYTSPSGDEYPCTIRSASVKDHISIRFDSPKRIYGKLKTGIGCQLKRLRKME